MPITCVWCDRFALQDAILNVLLFLPLGIGLGVAGVRWLPASAMIGVLTLGIEAAQFALIPGRDPSLRDLLVNLFGGLAGVAMGQRWRPILLPHRRVAWRLAGGTRLVWVAVHALAGWLLAPSLPAKPSWIIAGTHVGGFPDFTGRVVRWGLATTPPIGWRGERSDRALAGADLVIVPGPRTSALTPILTVVQQVGIFPFLLGEQGDDLVIRVRTRAERAGLRSPGYRLAGAIRPWYRGSSPTNNLLRIQLARTADRAEVQIRTSTGALLTSEVAVRTTQWWAMLWPAWYDFGPDPDVLSALWCLLLLLPLGYWTALTGRYRWRMGWMLAIVATASGFIMGPVFFAQAPPGWAELAGAAAGLALGGGLGVLVLRAKVRRTHLARV